MSSLFVIACILIVLGLVAFLIGLTGRRQTHTTRGYDDDEGRVVSKEKPVYWARPLTLGGIGILVIGGCFLLGASVTSVPAQSVGVQVAFGKPIHNFEPGLHWKRPWSVVIDMNGQTQTEKHLGDQRTEIRLGNQATGFVQNSLRWKINTAAAGNLYADYRQFDNIGPNLVDLELAAALNESFANYDPLANAKAAEGDPTAKKITNDDLAQIAQDRLTRRIGDRIIIEQVVVSKVDFDDATQNRINQYQQEIGNTRIAEQREKTAAADARANERLAASLSKNPNVLVSKCLDQQREMIEKGQAIPIGGLGCWPGGATPSVIVQPKQ